MSNKIKQEAELDVAYEEKNKKINKSNIRRGHFFTRWILKHRDDIIFRAERRKKNKMRLTKKLKNIRKKLIYGDTDITAIKTLKIPYYKYLRHQHEEEYNLMETLKEINKKG